MPRWNSCSVRTRDLVGGRVDDAVGGGQPRGRGGEARDPVHRGRGADVGAVGAGAATPRAVDDEVDLAGGDELHGVGAGRLADLRHPRVHRDAGGLERVGGAGGGDDPEPGLDEPPRRLDADGLVAVGERHEHAAAGGQPVTGRQLALGEGEPEGGVDAHDLAGAAHLGAEHRVGVGEAAERAAPPP